MSLVLFGIYVLAFIAKGYLYFRSKKMQNMAKRKSNKGQIAFSGGFSDDNYLQYAGIKYLAIFYTTNGHLIALCTQVFIAWGYYTETNSVGNAQFASYLSPLILTIIQILLLLSLYIEHSFINLIFENNF